MLKDRIIKEFCVSRLKKRRDIFEDGCFQSSDQLFHDSLTIQSYIKVLVLMQKQYYGQHLQIRLAFPKENPTKYFMIVFCTAVFQTKCTGHNDEAFNSSVLRSETSKYILQTFIASTFVYKTASITVITIFQPMGKSVHYQGFN